MTWVSEVEFAVSTLESEYEITVCTGYGPTRSHSNITTVSVYRTRVAIPYIDTLLGNIRKRFSDKAIQILSAMSVFHPASLPEKDSVSTYGNNEIACLANFYGKPAEVEFQGTTYSSPTLLNGEDLLSEWKLFKRAMLQERASLNTPH